MFSGVGNENGMTLVEVMVTVGIFAILLGMFGAGMKHWVPEYRFSNYVVDLQNAIQRARLSAVKNKADVFIEVDKTGGEYRVYLDDTSDSVNRGSLDAGDSLLDAASTPSDVVYDELFGSGTDTLSQITFDVRGFSDMSGEIHLKNINDSYKGVSLTLAGSSRIIRSGDGSAWQ